MIQNFDQLNIKYDQHPAFKQVEFKSKLSEIEILQQVSAIDKSLADIAAKPYDSLSKLKSDYNQQVASKIRRLEKYVLSGLEGQNTRRLFALSISKTIAQLLFETRYINRKHFYKNILTPESGVAWERANRLTTKGICTFEPTGKSQAIIDAAERNKPKLLEVVKENEGGRSAISVPPTEPLWDAVNAYFKEQNILDIASDYKQCPMELIYCSMEYAFKDQSWYKDCYKDINMPTSKTAYMHYDYDCEMIKAMFYLNDVTQTNGSFSYVVGSHRWPRSRFLIALYRDMDMETHTVYGLDNKSYYRKRFSDPSLRKEFAQLPKLFQGTSHFGDDILDNSELSKNLLTQEQVMTGPKGTFVMFDGGLGVHRGGLVSDGERWAIQIGFRITDDSTVLEKINNKKTRAINKLKRMMKI